MIVLSNASYVSAGEMEFLILFLLYEDRTKEKSTIGCRMSRERLVPGARSPVLEFYKSESKFQIPTYTAVYEAKHPNGTPNTTGQRKSSEICIGNVALVPYCTSIARRTPTKETVAKAF